MFGMVTATIQSIEKAEPLKGPRLPDHSHIGDRIHQY